MILAVLSICQATSDWLNYLAKVHSQFISLLPLRNTRQALLRPNLGRPEWGFTISIPTASQTVLHLSIRPRFEIVCKSLTRILTFRDRMF